MELASGEMADATEENKDQEQLQSASIKESELDETASPAGLGVTQSGTEIVKDAIDIALEEDNLADQPVDSAEGKTRPLKEESSSSEDDSSDSSSSESSSEEESENDVNNPDREDVEVPRTRNEILEAPVQRLPEDFALTETMTIEPVGTIFSIGDKAMVIQANSSGEYRILDEGTVFCLEDRTLIGVLCETFGQVERPLYVVRFENAEEMSKFSDKKGAQVYYVVPNSQFVLTEKFKCKGSDASNFHDEELPAEEQDFSDDEQEALAKQSKKRRRTRKPKDRATSLGLPSAAFADARIQGVRRNEPSSHAHSPRMAPQQTAPSNMPYQQNAFNAVPQMTQQQAQWFQYQQFLQMQQLQMQQMGMMPFPQWQQNQPSPQNPQQSSGTQTGSQRDQGPEEKNRGSSEIHKWPPPPNY